MKKNLLALFLFAVFSITMQSQTTTSDYVSGISDANFLAKSGTDLYVLGSENIYKIDTSSNSPTPTVIYTIPADFYLVNFTMNGSIIYVALENYIEASETFLGGKIISIDANNLSNPAQDIYTTGEYISSITNNGTTLYITSETLLNAPEFEPFITHLDAIDASLPNPSALVIANNVTNTSVISGITFDNGIVYLASSDDDEILKIEVNQPNPTVDVVTTATYSRGLFKLGNELYISSGSLISKFDVTNTAAGSTSVAVNTTYQDTNPNNGSLFYANFRDVVVVGNVVYATLRNQGKVVQAIDETLSANQFNVAQITILATKNTLYINGLENPEGAKVFNVSGQLVTTKKITSTNNSIDISSLSSGVYVLTMPNNKTFKFVK